MSPQVRLIEVFASNTADGCNTPAKLPYEHVETSKRMRMRFLTKAIIQTYTTMHTYLLGDVIFL